MFNEHCSLSTIEEHYNCRYCNYNLLLKFVAKTQRQRCPRIHWIHWTSENGRELWCSEQCGIIYLWDHFTRMTIIPRSSAFATSAWKADHDDHCRADAAGATICSLRSQIAIHNHSAIRRLPTYTSSEPPRCGDPVDIIHRSNAIRAFRSHSNNNAISLLLKVKFQVKGIWIIAPLSTFVWIICFFTKSFWIKSREYSVNIEFSNDGCSASWTTRNSFLASN